MNLYQFNNVIYKGNINKDFYFYCLKKNPRLIKYIFLNVLYFLISIFSLKNKNLYEEKKFNYLKNIKNINEEIKNFYKIKERYNNYLNDKVDIIVDRIPKIFVDKKLCSNIVGYEFDSKFNVNLKKYTEEKNRLNKFNKICIRNKYELENIECNNFIYVNNNKIKYFYSSKRKKINTKLLSLLYIIILSLLLTLISFFYTNYNLNIKMYMTYFEPVLFILNFLPIFFILLLLFLIFKKINFSFLITSIVVMALGISNQTKLLYRDDIVKFEDLSLLKESFIMTQRYDIVIKKYTIAFIIFIILLFFILRRYEKKHNFGLKKQLISIVVIIAIIIFFNNTLFHNSKIYNKVGDSSQINIWIGTRQYQIRGLIYPFIYTSYDWIVKPPAGYDKKEAKKVLDKYEYENIPKNKKVNIICIMLEAYNDFSRFDSIEFTEDIYAPLKEIEKKSIHGNLVTTIFGGGTITTERNFLTGYYNFPSFRKNTNSYVWYFKEQGYKTEAMHPIYGAFYNRASVNPNLGFDEYYNYENKYSKIQNEFVDDDIFFSSIIEGFEKSKESGIPYFNFSVTYQNHGPYRPDNYVNKKYYIKNRGYSDENYNIVNEYLDGIKKTNNSLKNLINYFEQETEPTIIVFFGDHNPFLGDNSYNELGINLSLNSIEGFENYYETPYVIYANESAKKTFDRSFVGKGELISPIFLMNELFDYCDLDGNQYLQYMSDLKKKVSIINPYYYMEDNKFVLVEDSKSKEIIDEYNKINYYYSKNYLKQH